MTDLNSELHVVTGALGYSGKYIAHRLLAAGHRVRTLTSSGDRPDPFGGRVEVAPLAFDDPGMLIESLRGARVLYNTYWVRFNHRTFAHSIAVDNTVALFEAARAAGIERIVHTSITNPDAGASLEYFDGKALLERRLRESGLSYAILRPALLFGPEDILINNIAWSVRHLPVLGVFGDGSYRLQPIYVDDFAALAVREGEASEDRIVDAVGPETFTYRELVEALAECLGIKRRVVGVPRWFGFAVCWVLGLFLKDKMITWPEVKGLMSDLLATDSPPAGATRLTDWARANADRLGVKYASELARRRDRTRGYLTAPWQCTGEISTQHPPNERNE